MQKSSACFGLDVSPLSRPINVLNNDIINLSRRLYCRPRSDVEQLIRGSKQFRETRKPDNAASLSTPDLSDRQKRFMECLLNHPALSITELYTELGLSAYMGNRIKNELTGSGFVSELVTNSGSGSRVAKFLIPTVTGSKLLDSSDLAGRGSTLHKFLQAMVASLGTRKQYMTTIEAQISESGKSIDVRLEKQGKTIAVEISLFSKEVNEVANIQRCLVNGIDNVVVVCIDPDQMESVQKLAGETLRTEEMEKVRFCLLTELWGML